MCAFVEDKRLLSHDSSGTVLQSTRGSDTVMSAESCLRENDKMQQIQKIQGSSKKSIQDL